jgi:hypothetical protein
MFFLCLLYARFFNNTYKMHIEIFYMCVFNFNVINDFSLLVDDSESAS